MICDGAGHIVELRLSGKGLAGVLAPELGDLPRLSSLLLEENGLSGSVPSSFGFLDSLQYLTLASNQLTGTPPTCHKEGTPLSPSCLVPLDTIFIDVCQFKHLNSFIAHRPSGIVERFIFNVIILMSATWQSVLSPILQIMAR